MDILIKDRLEFRRLLSEHGLVKLAGGPEDAIAWLEGTIAEVVYGVSKRQRFLELLREAREMLTRGQDESKVLPNGERKERPHPLSGRRFRRIKI